jgi:hypothetical protein
MGDGSQWPKTRSRLLAGRVQIWDVWRQFQLAWPNLCVTPSDSRDVTIHLFHRASGELLAYREPPEVLSILR